MILSLSIKIGNSPTLYSNYKFICTVFFLFPILYEIYFMHWLSVFYLKVAIGTPVTIINYFEVTSYKTQSANIYKVFFT